MESIIEYYYGLSSLSVSKNDDYYLVSCLKEEYVFEELLYDENELKSMLDILNQTKILYHLVVLTKDGDLKVNYDGKDYVLLKIRKDVSSQPLIFDFNEVKVSGKVNWGDLWSRRIDFYETQIDEVVKDDSVKYALQYYIGMTENAISFFNNLQEYYDDKMLVYGLGHRYLKVPLDSMNFYDPLNIFVDLDIRDLAEYVKLVFFDEQMTDYNILLLIDGVNFTEVSANYFLDRLMYPSYFFRVYDDYIDKRVVSKNMFLIIKKSHEFENLVKEIYSRLSVKYNIKINNWFFKFQH